jgi:hypothetical protein
MAEVQRVRLKKIYVGRAAIFGLGYGLILGIIFGIIAVFVGFTSLSGQTILGINFGNDIMVGASIALGFAVLIGTIISSVISFIILSAIYNLVSKFKLMIDVEFMEYEAPVKVTQERESSI